MKHVFGAAAMAVGLFAISSFGMTQVAEAGQIKIEVNDNAGTGYWGANGGGEFKVTTFSGSGSFVPTPVFGNGTANAKFSDGIFQTFCLERNEGIDTYNTFDFTIGDSAVAGGISGGSPNPLDAMTAYLYTKFWLGTLTGYNYTPGTARINSATALQLAIWKIEGELAGDANHPDLTAQYNANSLAVQFYNDALANNNGSIGLVRVLNLTLSGENKQSLLVLTLPIPSSAWLGLGMMSVLGVVGVIRRRKRQALV